MSEKPEGHRLKPEMKNPCLHLAVKSDQMSAHLSRPQEIRSRGRRENDPSLSVFRQKDKNGRTPLHNAADVHPVATSGGALRLWNIYANTQQKRREPELDSSAAISSDIHIYRGCSRQRK
jgi:hypothetical protein